jgi:hypothetical protein
MGWQESTSGRIPEKSCCWGLKIGNAFHYSDRRSIRVQFDARIQKSHEGIRRAHRTPRPPAGFFHWSLVIGHLPNEESRS